MCYTASVTPSAYEQHKPSLDARPLNQVANSSNRLRQERWMWSEAKKRATQNSHC